MTTRSMAATYVTLIGLAIGLGCTREQAYDARAVQSAGTDSNGMAPSDAAVSGRSSVDANGNTVSGAANTTANGSQGRAFGGRATDAAAQPSSGTAAGTASGTSQATDTVVEPAPAAAQAGRAATLKKLDKTRPGSARE